MAYTNSSMVVYTKLSPNHSGQRTHTIDRISPHCIVGQLSAESIGEWFAKKSTKASSNYGIDKDGRVALYVEEKDRSWCTSSSANDQRAVTIECASDKEEPYAFRNVVYERLVSLCTDICRRNGKKKLLWLGDKEKTLKYSPASDEMVLTVHRWFKNKSCPGNWLMARMDDLASRVTAALAGSGTSGKGTASTADDAKQIWDRLYASIGNPCGVAGVMGNMQAESGLRSNNLQQTYEKSLGMTDEEYTGAVDGGSYREFVTDKAGYGLVQWTYWSLKQGLLNYAVSRGKSIGDWQMQVDFFLKEMEEEFPAVMRVLKAAPSVREASDAVLLQFERPADQSEAVRAKRAGYGQEFFDRFAGEAKGTSFLVRVAITNLNIRTGPGTDYSRTGLYTGTGTFTIVETSPGMGSKSGWGLLKSYTDSRDGWISLDYCVKI